MSGSGFRVYGEPTLESTRSLLAFYWVLVGNTGIYIVYIYICWLCGSYITYSLIPY